MKKTVTRIKNPIKIIADVLVKVVSHPLSAVTEDFNANYKLHQDSILRFCVWKSRSSEVGEDLAQETFLRYFACLQRDEPIQNTRALLYRIARNLFIDHVRKKQESSLDDMLETGFEPSVDTWHETYSHLDAERPLREIQNMAHGFRTVLTQRFMKGLTPGEIGLKNGESANTVSVRIFRALKQLRTVLDQVPLVLPVAILAPVQHRILKSVRHR